MNDFVKFFLFFQFSVQLVSVVSYTVVLKQVKTLHPSVKVYKYEVRPPKFLPESNAQYIYHKPLLGQRIYPVPLKHGRDANFKPRPPIKKEKGSYYRNGEKSLPRDPRLLGVSPSQHLVPPVSNQLEEHSEAKEEAEEEDVRPVVTYPNLGKSFSSFPQEKGKLYNHSGEWATPTPQADSENTTNAEFTPSQLYLQIRHKNTVIHVPQSEALKDAETLEELINAPRLKELARTTHVQETYSEEGYEDAAYDHAGHIRQAQHGEVYDAKDEGKFKIKDPPVIIDYDSDLEESKKVPSRNYIESTKETPDENLSNKLEPRTTRSRSEVSKTGAEYLKIPKSYKGEHKYSSRVKGPVAVFDEKEKFHNGTKTKELPSIAATFPSYFGEMPPTPESFLSNDSDLQYKPPHKKSSKYRKGEFSSTKIYPVTDHSPEDPTQVNNYTDFKPYISLIDSQASPSAKSLKYSRIYSKKTKHLRLEPYQHHNIFSPPPLPPANTAPTPHEDLQPPSSDDKTKEEEPLNQRIVLPTIGYINSLTTAHFGKDNAKTSQEESKTEITDALNLTQALNYLRAKKTEKSLESTQSPSEIDIRSFESMKLKKTRPALHTILNKSKRDVYLMKTPNGKSENDSKEYEGNDESDAPHDEKNEEIAEDERKRIEDENLEKEKYEASLREEISNQEKEILKETYNNMGVEEDISEVFPESALPESESDSSSQTEETAPIPVNVRKYPFYLSKRLPENSALRYATDPKQFPKKSGYQMEFYDSREGVIQCPDFHPELEDLPNSNSTEYSEEPTGGNQRLIGLGDKIACLRMKYFDPEPFDNPIFLEKKINYVGKPKNQKKIQTKVYPKSSNGGNENFYQTPSRGVKHQAPSFHSENYVSQERQNNPTNIPTEMSNIHFLRLGTNKTEVPRVIPVTETYDDVSPPPTTFSTPLIGWRTIYHSRQPSQHHPRYSKVLRRLYTHSTKPSPKHLVIPHNCLHNINNLAQLDGTKNMTIDCKDATVIQTVIKNVARLRIIPKEEKKHLKKKWSDSFSTKSLDESDWVPIVGTSPRKHFGGFQTSLTRRTDEVTKLKNETDNVNSNHYVIDRLKEEENVRKGEVVDDVDHHTKIMSELKYEEETTEETTEEEATEATTAEAENVTKASEKRKRREAQTDSPVGQTTQNSGDEKSEGLSPADISKLFHMKRPLKRLSGRDFLVRYHKNKGKATTEKTEDFWKVTNTQKPQRKHTGTETPISSTIKTTEETTKTPSVSTTEASTRRTETVVEVQQSKSSTEKNSKFKIKKQTETRKILPLNLIPEKVTKRPEVKTSDIRKTSPNPLETPKIVTKISVEMSQSTKKSPNGQKEIDASQNPKAETLAKPEIQYKTINRNSNSFSNESKNLSKSTENSEEPVLYYVVNLKTGRGKWITNYEERLRESHSKAPQNLNLKENSGTKRNKRRRKFKYQ